MELNIEIPEKYPWLWRGLQGPRRELDLPQTAFDILMFLGNNPAYKTASEIVELRHIKANLISVHVERLVQEGYLIRRPSPTDRRKTELFCTEKALPVIRRGRQRRRISWRSSLPTRTRDPPGLCQPHAPH